MGSGTGSGTLIQRTFSAAVAQWLLVGHGSHRLYNGCQSNHVAKSDRLRKRHYPHWRVRFELSLQVLDEPSQVGVAPARHCNDVLLLN